RKWLTKPSACWMRHRLSGNRTAWAEFGQRNRKSCLSNRNLGGDKGDRTPDLVNAIHALSQLSYIPRDERDSTGGPSARQESLSGGDFGGTSSGCMYSARSSSSSKWIPPLRVGSLRGGGGVGSGITPALRRVAGRAGIGASLARRADGRAGVEPAGRRYAGVG